MASAIRFPWPTRLGAIALLLMLAPPAHALRIVDYNLLNYPGSSGATRDPNFRTVLSPLDADVIVTEEQTSQAGVNEFLNSVLNTMDPPDTWGVMSFLNGNDSDAALYYRKATVDTLGHWAFYPSATQLRLVNVFRIRPAGYSSEAAELRIYTAHLKASTGYETDRLNECIGIRDSMNAMPAGTRALLVGDMNFYTTEAGYLKLLESQANNVGRVYDMLPAGSWHDNLSFATIHTQSTCMSGCLYGEATGGKDDRFDFILPTLNLASTQGLAAIPGTMRTAGADDQHFNKAITDAPTIPEGAAYAAALLGTSDHLPVWVDLQAPAKVSSDASLAFGSVIVGAVAEEPLAVTNPAVAPADSLNYTLAAPAGFTAPAGPFALAPGAPAASHSIGMTTTGAGTRSGDLAIASDAPDEPTRLVALSGTVLDHAQASLDSLAAVAGDTLDFGAHAAGDFAPMLAAVHDLGYTALRARLSVSAAEVAGGDGRFAIHDFAPALVAGTAARWTVTFDAAGATTDSAYEATLAFTSADEPLPGAAPQPGVAYVLRATVSRGPGAVEPSLPVSTRLFAPMPNPLASGTTLRFDLARPTEARLEIFDLSGRRLRTLAEGAFAPGRYQQRWDGRAEGGAPAGPGLYFVRLTTRGSAPQTVRLAIVR